MLGVIWRRAMPDGFLYQALAARRAGTVAFSKERGVWELGLVDKKEELELRS